MFFFGLLRWFYLNFSFLIVGNFYVLEKSQEKTSSDSVKEKREFLFGYFLIFG